MQSQFTAKATDSVGPSLIRLRKILFATDFSPTSAMALPYAAAVARRFGAEIFAVHVVPEESYSHIPIKQLDSTLTEMKRAARQRIAGLLEGAHFAGIPFQIVLDHGDPMTVVSTLVERYDIDWIVTGSHGRHGVHKLFSPAVGEAIARAAACPVLLVGPQVAIEPQAEVRIERLLCATDFAPGSRRALDYAHALAKAYHAHLYVFHATADVYKEPISTRMKADDFCRMRLRENGLPHEEPVIETEYLVDFGPPEQLTLEAAAARDVQLIVLPVEETSHPGLASHLPGPLAYNIASHARCPVLMVRNSG